MSTDSSAASSTYRIQHLSGVENYSTWKIKMLDILTDMGLKDYALGMTQKPNQPDSSSKALAWKKKDRQTLSTIRLRNSTLDLRKSIVFMQAP
ncbi:hypothetical protein L218DRAFT_1006849 [Marasmius fiardii PR-910]|nr:hypothetical protein L218DRAFT_1006849 [Marasmius fiardii PR-910]